MIPTEESVTAINASADFWRRDIGVNVIPADTINKRPLVSWSQWQKEIVPERQHEQWKREGAFSKGMAIIPGKVWHRADKKGSYFTFLDADKQGAIEELCTRNGKTVSLHEMTQKFLVEQHKDNPDKAHIYFYSPIPFPQKAADSILGLEVKGLGEHGIAFCSPSIHKDGMPYEIIGTNQPVTLSVEQARQILQHIDQICIKHGLKYLERGLTHSNVSNRLRNVIKTLVIDPTVKIPQGQRHVTLISAANSLLFRHLRGGKSKSAKTEQELRDFFEKINYILCEPEPLPGNEVDSIWDSALEFVTRTREEEQVQADQLREQEREQHPAESIADALVKLAIENILLLFKDQYQTPFALIHIVDHNEILRVEGNNFKRYLSKLFYDDNDGQRVANIDAINNAIQILQAKAEYEGQTINLSLRVAWSNNNNDNNTNYRSRDVIYYDLTDEKWRYIKITKERWELVNNETPVPLFVRYNQTSQVQPDPSYEHDTLDKFLQLTNVKDDQNKLLLTVYIVSLFIPGIAHAILVLHGEKGSAKSTLQLLIKLLVDPSKPSLLTIHKDRSEFVQQLNHNHVAFYDNVKQVPYWLSDEACKAVTGIGQTKRRLYSDDDDIVYEYKRCLGFNGINISLTEPDALDRSILIELNRISKENRRLESDILSEFDKMRPQLLGYVFDIIVEALRIKPTLKLRDLPRMADFALWGEAIARAMGYKDLEFIDAYYDNIGRQNIEAIENHPLGHAIAKFFDAREEEQEGDGSNNDVDSKLLEGSPLEILEVLEVFAVQNKINTNHRLWPKSPNSLTRRLNQIRSNLLEGLGIDVSITRLTSQNSANSKGKAAKVNTSYIKIRKISPVSPISPVAQNHEGNSAELTGDILSTGGIISPANEIPLAEGTQNHAQNSANGDTGGSGDIFSIEGDDHQIDNKSADSIIDFKCYYCQNFQTDNETEYHRHGIIRHPNRPLYPTKADLQRLGLKAQERSWET